MTQPPDDAALVATQTWAGIRMAPGAATPELRDAARKTNLFRHGDMLLMWVNEGDLMVADMAARRAAAALEAKDRRIAELEALDRPIDAPPNGEPDPSWAAIKRGIDQFVGRVPTVGKHRAMNNVHLKTVVERLDAAGDQEAADTIVWQAWWRALDRERERFLLDGARAALEPSDKGVG